MREQTLGPNSLIFAAAEPGTSMMIVKNGQVRISSISSGGREATIRMIEPGECFGELALLDGKPRSATATTHKKTTLLVLRKDEFEPLLRASPEMTSAIIGVLCERLRSTTSLLEDCLFASSKARVLQLLVELADYHGEPNSRGGMKIRRRLMSQEEMANKIFTTRETVNREMRLLKDNGLLIGKSDRTSDESNCWLVISDWEEFRACTTKELKSSSVGPNKSKKRKQR